MPRMLPVLLGGDANVYGMARSFYECYGVRSLAVCRRALPALAHSRLVRVAVQDPAFGQDHVFTATLLGLAAQYPGVPKILISCADDYTALLARHADALRGAYRFACPPPAALHLADKRQFAAACRAAGLMAEAGKYCVRRAKEDLTAFLNERWKGMAPVAWGDTLRESEFTMWLYDGVCGLTSANNTK